MQAKPSYRIDILWLTLLLAVLFGSFLGSRAFLVPDEGRYVEIPREMNLTGDYITPHLNDIKYFEKPPLFYWLEAATLSFFGEQEGAARLAPLLLGLLGVLMTYVAGRKLYNRRTGILAGLVLASNPMYFVFSHMVIPDIALTIFFSAAMLCFLLGSQESNYKLQKRYFIAMYGFVGLAVMTKGIVAILLSGATVFFWLLLTNNLRLIKALLLPSGVFLFCLITLPWHLLVQQRNPEFFHFYFLEQQFLRYATNYAGRNQPIWFITASILGGFFPWSVFLISSTIKTLARTRPLTFFLNLRSQPILLFLVLWIAVFWLFFTCSHSQLVTYVLPVMPPLSLIAANFFSCNWEKNKGSGLTGSFIAISVLMIIGSIGAAIFAPRQATEFWYVSAVLLGLTGIVCLFAYQRYGFKEAIIALMVGMSLSLISVNLNFDSIDNRSVKPLAMKLLPLLQPKDEVIAYNEYYQDLPVYLQRRITVVNRSGELSFGMQHQQHKEWMIDSQTLWQKWQAKSRVFLIIKRKDYSNLLKIDKVFKSLWQTHPLNFYLLAESEKNFLYSNLP